MFQDLAFGVRNLRSHPGFAITAVLALAAGIGANSAMFSVIDGVLLKPLPFPQPERLVNVWEGVPKRNIPRLPAPVGNYLDWQTMNHVLSDMGAFSQAAFSLASTTEPERYLGARCDQGLFSTLRVRPVMGRPFRAEDHASGHDTVVVIGSCFWTQRFGGNPFPPRLSRCARDRPAPRMARRVKEVIFIRAHRIVYRLPAWITRIDGPPA